MRTRHNLGLRSAGLELHHAPVASAEGADALEELLAARREAQRRRGGVHGNRHTDFVAAVCAAHLYGPGVEPREGLRAAVAAGLR